MDLYRKTVPEFEIHRETSLFAGEALRQQPFLQELIENLREYLFPRHLPPLVLTSHPVAVIDIHRIERNPRTSAISFGLHGLLIGGILWLAYQGIPRLPSVMPTPATSVEISTLKPPLLFARAEALQGGGAAGGLTPASQGRLPKYSDQPLSPPVIPRNENPALLIAPTIQTLDGIHFDSPLLGDPFASKENAASLGKNGKDGFGNEGNGPGYGHGRNGGLGIYRLGGSGVTRPFPLFTPEAEYSDQARRARFQGASSLVVVVDERGNVADAWVLRPLGMGLDEKAISAVRTWRFKPGTYNGRPVKVEVPVIVEFHLM
jgi:TonB family protein